MTEPEEQSIENELIETEQAHENLFPRKRSTELRLTVVEQLYYQQPGVEAVQIEAGYSHFVQENEQAFKRISLATPEWKSLNLGWITKASCIIIQNRHGTDTRRTLTGEELAEQAKYVIQVRFKDSAYWMEIAPRESVRFKTPNLAALELRSAYGEPRYIYHLIPE